ncbi:unnamed protein product [Ostreobium quekettii]|uniref:Uncharacterized protein n=1 Tax=Ostreobium quekettii TaxID=121088 RepID=A0A8S1JJ16_9CHLO|nr:unnamed protein product [Ostreobium quekettii]
MAPVKNGGCLESRVLKPGSWKRWTVIGSIELCLANVGFDPKRRGFSEVDALGCCPGGRHHGHFVTFEVGFASNSASPPHHPPTHTNPSSTFLDASIHWADFERAKGCKTETIHKDATHILRCIRNIPSYVKMCSISVTDLENSGERGRLGIDGTVENDGLPPGDNILFLTSFP